MQVIEELKKEEQAKKKKKPALTLTKEKRLQYYSGWGKGKVEKVEKQKKLS